MRKELNNSRMLIWLLIGIAIIYFAAGLNFDMNIYDEGIGLVGAERVSSGELPYKDFWTIYTPLNYYITAGFSFLFGKTLIAARILSLIISLSTFYFLHLLIRKANDNQPKFSAGLALIITLGFSLFIAKAMGVALLFSAVSILFFIRSYIGQEKKPIKTELFLSGLMNGLTILTRLDIGVYLLCSLIISSILRYLLIKNPDIYSNRINQLKSIIYFITGLLTPVLPVTVYFLLNVNFSDLYYQLIYVPLTTFSQYRKIPRPGLSDIFKAHDLKGVILNLWIGVYALLPFAIILAFADKLIVTFRNKHSLNSRLFIFMPLAIFTFFLLAQTSIRPDYEHFLPTWIFSITAIFALYDKSSKNKIDRYSFSIIIIGFIGFLLLTKTGLIRKSFSPENISINSVPRAKNIVINNEWKADLESAVIYIKSTTSENDRILVCNDRHDKGYRNDVLFYYLCERFPATRYHEMHPGIISTGQVQNEIINELINKKVKLIVRVYKINNYIEPNLSSVSSGVHLLDNYIDNHYHPTHRFGIYEILELNPTF